MDRSTEPRIVAVLLAAGEARRFGSAKQLAPVDGVPLVRRSALAILEAGLPLMVVTGAHAQAVGAALANLPLTLLHNPDWQMGMGRSIATAVASLGRDESLDGVMICLADQPRIGAMQLRALLGRHALSRHGITAADHGQVAGPPCVFGREYFAELMALSGADGARRLLAAHASEVRRLPMPEAAIDIDTPEQYRALQAAQRS